MKDIKLNLIIDSKTGQASIKKVSKDVEKLGRVGKKSADKLSDSFNNARKNMIRFSVGITAAVTALALIGKKSLESADKIGKVATKLGITTDALQEYRHAAELSGVAQNTLDMALQRFTRRVAEAAQGTGELKDTLIKYGIAIKKADGSTRRTEDVFDDFADAIAGADTEAEALRIAFKGLDSEGAALVVMLKDGSTGLNIMREEARELGIVLSEDLIKQAERSNDAIYKVGKVISTAFTIAVTTIAPEIEKAAIQMSKWVMANKDLLKTTITDYAEKASKAIGFFATNVGMLVDVLKFYLYYQSAAIILSFQRFVSSAVAAKKGANAMAVAFKAAWSASIGLKAGIAALIVVGAEYIIQTEYIQKRLWGVATIEEHLSKTRLLIIKDLKKAQEVLDATRKYGDEETQERAQKLVDLYNKQLEIINKTIEGKKKDELDTEKDKEAPDDVSVVSLNDILAQREILLATGMEKEILILRQRYIKELEEVEKYSEEYNALWDNMELETAQISAKYGDKRRRLEKKKFKKMDAIVSSFNKDYKKLTMSTYKYEMKLLDEKVDAYIKADGDKLIAHQYYVIQGAKIEKKAIDASLKYVKEEFKERHALMDSFRESWGLTWEEIGKGQVDVCKDIQEAMVSMSHAIGDAIVSVLSGTKTLGEAAKDLLKDVLSQVISTLIAIIVQQTILGAASVSIATTTIQAMNKVNVMALPAALALAAAEAAASWGASAAVGAKAFGAAMASMGVISAGIIATAKGTGMATGGEIGGSSPNDRADNIPIMATAGEWVMPVDAVRRYGTTMMSDIQHGKYAWGGQVASASVPERAFAIQQQIGTGKDFQQILDSLPKMVSGYHDIGREINHWLGQYSKTQMKIAEFHDTFAEEFDKINLSGEKLKSIGVDEWYEKQKDKLDELNTVSWFYADGLDSMTDVYKELEELYKLQKQAIVDKFLEPVMEVIDKATMSAEAFKMLELDKEYEKQIKTANELGISLDEVNKAYDLQKEAIVSAFTDPTEDIIAKHTLTDQELDMRDLDAWYKEQIKTAGELGLETDRITYAYELEKEAIEETTGAIEETIDALGELNEELSTFLGMLDSLTDAQVEAQKSVAVAGGMSESDWYLKQVHAAGAALGDDYTLQDLTDAGDVVLSWYNAAVAEEITKAQNMAEAFNDVADAIGALLSSIDDVIKSIKYGSLNVILPTQREAMGVQDYDTLLAAAMLGGEEDIEKFLSFAPEYLQLAQDVWKSSGSYQLIYKSVMADLDMIKGYVESDAFENKMYNQFMIANDTLNTIEVDLSAINITLQTFITAIEELAKGATDSTSIAGLETKYGQTWTEESVGEWLKTVGSMTFEDFKSTADLYNIGISELLKDISTILTHFGYEPSDYGFQHGGISSGPMSGYPVTLHGTEAIIPLQDGAVPVKILGGGEKNTEPPQVFVTVTLDGNEISANVQTRIKDYRDRGMKNEYIVAPRVSTAGAI